MCGRRTGRDSSRKRRNVRACSRAMHPQRASGMPKTPQEARDPARSSALMDASSDAISQDHRGNGVLRYLDRSHPSFAIGASSRMHRLARNAYRRMPQHCNRTVPTAILPCHLRLSSVLRHLRYRILVPSSMSCPPRLPSAPIVRIPLSAPCHRRPSSASRCPAYRPNDHIRTTPNIETISKYIISDHGANFD